MAHPEGALKRLQGGSCFKLGQRKFILPPLCPHDLAPFLAPCSQWQSQIPASKDLEHFATISLFVGDCFHVSGARVGFATGLTMLSRSDLCKPTARHAPKSLKQPKLRGVTNQILF